MKLISYILFGSMVILPLSLKQSFASDEVQNFLDKEYIFYALKRSTIYHLNGKKRYKKINTKEFLNPKEFSSIPNFPSPKGIARDIVFYRNKGFEIILRKESKYFSLIEGKLKKVNPYKLLKTIKKP